jgi:FkbM family methyltransferase
MIILTPKNDYRFTSRDSRDDPSDDHDLDYKVVKETWVENVYHIEKGDFADTGVFVDIGANIGAVSIFVDSLNHERDEDMPVIKTYAVEPEPHNIGFLQQNIDENPTTGNITVVKNAVWHESKTLEISNRGGNASIFKHPNNAGYAKVQAITIAEIFNTYNIREADVMKIDIEGAEFDLLINTPDDILKRIKYLTLEFDASNDGKFGIMVEKLARIFGIQILGSPERGGYIYGRRY